MKQFRPRLPWRQSLLKKLSEQKIKESKHEMAQELDPQQQAKDKDRRTGTGLAIGVAIGIALGTAMGNVGAGMVIGIAIGVAIGAARDK